MTRRWLWMTQDVPCEASKKKVIGLLTCNGACNVGVLTTKAVVGAIKKYDNINFVYPLGIPLGIEGIVNNVKNPSII
jgi:hypothetical protein